MSERAARRMTVAEFLIWQLSQRDRYELVDGRPVAMTGTKLRHDRVTSNALSEIQRQLRAAGNPCDAFTDDIGILTKPGQLRRPDVSVLCPPFDEESMTSDRPRLVVEVLSDSTERVDRLIKLDEYKSLESLDYIILADPARDRCQFMGDVLGELHHEDGRTERQRHIQGEQPAQRSAEADAAECRAQSRQPD